AASAHVQLLTQSGGQQVQSATANASGAYSFTNVEIGHPFQVRATHPTNPFDQTTKVGIVPSDGQSVEVDESLAAAGTVHVTVVDVDGASPLKSASVYVDRHNGSGATYAGAT